MSKKKRSNKTIFPKNTEEDITEIKKLAKIIAGSVGIQQIEKLATSEERKAIWVLCSGKLTREQISNESGVSLRTVTAFIDLAKTYGLVEEEKGKGGHPLRVIDYVPSEWKDLVKKKKKPAEEQKPQPST
jgi:hypothetical protein